MKQQYHVVPIWHLQLGSDWCFGWCMGAWVHGSVHGVDSVDGDGGGFINDVLCKLITLLETLSIKY